MPTATVWSSPPEASRFTRSRPTSSIRIRRGPDIDLPVPYRPRRRCRSSRRDGSAAAVVDGIKFETFVFDALMHAATPSSWRLRARRNSLRSRTRPQASIRRSPRPPCKAAYFAGWLEACGVRVPRDAAGRILCVPIEISPLFADSHERLKQRRDSGRSRSSGPVYLGAPE
jgi:hypothetical protein